MFLEELIKELEYNNIEVHQNKNSSISFEFKRNDEQCSCTIFTVTTNVVTVIKIEDEITSSITLDITFPKESIIMLLEKCDIK